MITCHVPVELAETNALMISVKEMVVFVQLLLVVVLQSDSYYREHHHDRICELIASLHNTEQLMTTLQDIEMFLCQYVCLSPSEKKRGYRYDLLQRRFMELKYKEFDTSKSIIKRFCDMVVLHKDCKAASKEVPTQFYNLVHTLTVQYKAIP
jgi:hypothetical protein